MPDVLGRPQDATSCSWRRVDTAPQTLLTDLKRNPKDTSAFGTAQRRGEKRITCRNLEYPPDLREPQFPSNPGLFLVASGDTVSPHD